MKRFPWGLASLVMLWLAIFGILLGSFSASKLADIGWAMLEMPLNLVWLLTEEFPLRIDLLEVFFIFCLLGFPFGLFMGVKIYEERKGKRK